MTPRPVSALGGPVGSGVVDRTPSLRQYPDFLKLWTGETIPVLGVMFAALAVTLSPPVTLTRISER